MVPSFRVRLRRVSAPIFNRRRNSAGRVICPLARGRTSLVRGSFSAKANLPSRIVFRPLPPDDPRLRCPDITRAVRLLGWRPRVSRREGLERTIADFRHRLTAQRG